ncbi:hypothetical protein D3C80_2125890 [compost metagenome]
MTGVAGVGLASVPWRARISVVAMPLAMISPMPSHDSQFSRSDQISMPHTLEKTMPAYCRLAVSSVLPRL